MSFQQIRRNHDGTVDEIVISGANVHIEQMGPDHWWIGITRGEGRDSKMVHVNLHSKSKITLAVEDEGIGCEEVMRRPSNKP